MGWMDMYDVEGDTRDFTTDTSTKVKKKSRSRRCPRLFMCGSGVEETISSNTFHFSFQTNLSSDDGKIKGKVRH